MLEPENGAFVTAVRGLDVEPGTEKPTPVAGPAFVNGAMVCAKELGSDDRGSTAEQWTQRSRGGVSVPQLVQIIDFPKRPADYNLAGSGRLELNPANEKHFTAVGYRRSRIAAKRCAVHYRVRILEIVVVP